MKKAVVFVFLLAIVFLPGMNARAEDPDTMRERMIGGAFKGFAEAVLAVTDLEKEKKKLIEWVDGADEKEFSSQYKRYWRIMKEWPLPVRLKYGIADHMTRDQLVGQVRAITKDDVHTLIQNVPDRIIAREFDRRLKRMGKQLQQTALPQQVQAVWEKVSAKLRIAQAEKGR